MFRTNYFLIFSVLILLILSSCGREIKLDYHANGRIKSELSYAGKQLDGESKYYYKNGVLQSQFNYHKGILEGKSSTYFFNGKMQTEDNYFKGEKHGLAKIYYESGEINEIFTYSTNVLNGVYFAYYADGMLRIEGKYLDNQFDSVWNYYDQYGRIVGLVEFESGDGILTAYYPNGIIMRTTTYRKSEKQGIEQRFNNKGELVKELIF